MAAKVTGFYGKALCFKCGADRFLNYFVHGTSECCNAPVTKLYCVDCGWEWSPWAAEVGGGGEDAEGDATVAGAEYE